MARRFVPQKVKPKKSSPFYVRLDADTIAAVEAWAGEVEIAPSTLAKQMIEHCLKDWPN